MHLDEARLRCLDAEADVQGVRAALRGYEGVCAGGERAGQAAGDDPGRRFRWLTAPRSTVVQPGPIHTGLTADAASRGGPAAGPARSLGAVRRGPLPPGGGELWATSSVVALTLGHGTSTVSAAGPTKRSLMRGTRGGPYHRA